MFPTSTTIRHLDAVINRDAQKAMELTLSPVNNWRAESSPLGCAIFVGGDLGAMIAFASEHGIITPGLLEKNDRWMWMLCLFILLYQ